MNDFRIDFSVVVGNETLVAVIGWDFDNWSLDGFYAVKGEFKYDEDIIELLHGKEDREEWEGVYVLPVDTARQLTEEEIDLHFKEWLESED